MLLFLCCPLDINKGDIYLEPRYWMLMAAPQSFDTSCSSALQPLVLGIVNVFWQLKAMLFTTCVFDKDAKSVLGLRLVVIASHE